jgi:hypothetical protein
VLACGQRVTEDPHVYRVARRAVEPVETHRRAVDIISAACGVVSIQPIYAW